MGETETAYYFTSDTHFGDKNTLIRENRPFSSVEEFDNYVINLWNKQVKSYDTIYHLGDFINYNCDEKESWRKAIKHIQKIKCKLILIIGNNEERLINEQFGNSINEFKKYAKSIGFKDIKKEDIIEFDNKEFYLNHYPSKHKEGYINLFGHTHRATGLWKR